MAEHGPIQMVDLQTQYRAIQSEIDQALQAILQQTNFINGAPVKDFACNLAGYLGARDVIPCANGTDALQIALMALDLQPGDEVITTPFTFVATAEVIALLGLKPVFVDIEPAYFNVNPDLVEAAITDRTRVIIPVHLFGQCAHMEPLLALSQKHGIYIVEDNAQAIGADYIFADGRSAKAGTLGVLGCTSFYPSKNLGAYGDGGALSTMDAALGEKVRMICNHGSRIRYYHDEIGVNSRLDTFQAAILDIKLRRLNDYIERRVAAANAYDNGLQGMPGMTIPARAPWSTHVFHQYTLRVPHDRDQLQQHLQSAGIPSMIYYPVALHLQPAYARYGYREGDMPVSEQMMKEVLSLPMHTELHPGQIDYICQTIRSYFNA
jgi:UDP-2-acetamido-2-deoxy-ribo-hexuluronate aminotransferase